MLGYLYRKYVDPAGPESDPDNSSEFSHKSECSSDGDYASRPDFAENDTQSSPSSMRLEKSASPVIVKAPKWTAINLVSDEPETKTKKKNRSVKKITTTKIYIRKHAAKVDEKPKPLCKLKIRPVTCKVAKSAANKRARRTEVELLLTDAKIYSKMFDYEIRE